MTKAPKQKRVNIEMPKDLKAVYANLAFISHTPAEMVLDFIQLLPRTPSGRVMSRIIMSPMHAKALLKALETNVGNYERQFGEIKLPQQPNIADQFFKFGPSDKDDKEKDDKEDEGKGD